MLPPMSEPTPMTAPAPPSMLPSPPEANTEREERDESVDVAGLLYFCVTEDTS